MCENRQWQEDWMNDFVIDEADLAEGELSELEQERILSRVLADAGLRQETKRGFSRRTMLAVCLVAVMTPAFGSMALANAVFDGRIAAFFGANEQQAEMLAGHSGTVLVSDKNAGGEITATQVLGDSHNIFVQLEVAAPEGTKLDAAWYLFRSAFAQINGVNSMGYSFDLLPDDDPADNRISMLLSLDASREIIGKTLKLQLADLYTGDAENDWTVAAGEWELDIPLNFTTLAEHYQLTQPVQLATADGDITITDMEISPLTVNFSAQGELVNKIMWQLDPEKAADIAPGAEVEAGKLAEVAVVSGEGETADEYSLVDVVTKESDEPVDVTLAAEADSWSYNSPFAEDITPASLKVRLTDGTVVGCTGSGIGNDMGRVQFNFTLEKMIDLEKIEAIEFMGEELQY